MRTLLQRCTLWAVTLTLSVPVPLYAHAEESVRTTGASALWMLANFSFAGMRAQGRGSLGWRIVAFIFGFPGTLLTLLAVQESSGRVYGVDLPGRGDLHSRDE